MIEVRVGDVLTAPERPLIIAHVLSNTGAYGAGFARDVARTWPHVRARFVAWHRGRLPVGAPPFRLGEVDYVPAGGGVKVANMVAQRGLRSASNRHPVDYNALTVCLHSVADVARRDTATVVMPRIGCGLGGSSWDRIGPIVERTLADVPTAVYDLPAL